MFDPNWTDRRSVALKLSGQGLLLVQQVPAFRFAHLMYVMLSRDILCAIEGLCHKARHKVFFLYVCFR